MMRDLRLAWVLLLACATALVSCRDTPGGPDPDGGQSGELIDYSSKVYPFISLTTEEEIVGPTRHGKDVDKASFYVNGRMLLNDPDGFYSDVPLVEATLKIRWRGHSTLNLEKKSYRIKLDKKASLLGINADKDWDLIANHPDKTLMRNMVAMRISEICGMGWTPKMLPVELWLNGDFKGNYMLSEHKEVNEDKVNINPDTDYYFEIESDLDNPAGFWTPVYHEPVMFQEPEEPDDSQVEYCLNYFTRMEEALRDGDFSQPGKREYEDYIDVDSFVNHYIIHEFCKTVDVLRKSTFLTLTSGGKLTFCHVWDFDLALGNCSYLHADPGAEDGPEGWWVKTVAPWRMDTGWYLQLFKDPQWREAVKKRWNEVKPGLATLPEYIDSLLPMHRASFERNFERWPVIGTNVWPNSWPEADLPQSYDEEVERLRDYCRQRLLWLDTNINNL